MPSPSPGFSTASLAAPFLTLWAPVSDGILSGARHDLGGRASAFSSLAHIADARGADDSFVIEQLQGESQRLAQLASLLQSFPTFGASGQRPLSISRTLDAAVALAELHEGTGGSELTCASALDVPAVTAEPGVLMRVLLITLLERAEAGAVAIVAEASAAESGLAILITGSFDADVDEPPSPADDSVQVLHAALATSGGSCTTLGKGGYRITLAGASHLTR